MRPPSEPPEGSDVEDEPVGMAVGDGDSEEDAVAGGASTAATVDGDACDGARRGDGSRSRPSSSDEGSDAEPPPPPSEEEEVAEEEDEEVDEEGMGARGGAAEVFSLRNCGAIRKAASPIMLAEDADGLYLKNMGDVDVDDDRSALRVHDYLHSIGGMPASRLSLAEARELIKSAADPLELSVRLEKCDPAGAFAQEERREATMRCGGSSKSSSVQQCQSSSKSSRSGRLVPSRVPRRRPPRRRRRLAPASTSHLKTPLPRSS